LWLLKTDKVNSRLIILLTCRVVAAKKNSKGEVAEVILYSTCADETQTYDAVKDTCS